MERASKMETGCKYFMSAACFALSFYMSLSRRDCSLEEADKLHTAHITLTRTNYYWRLWRQRSNGVWYGTRSRWW
eukprot:scaffold2914_cov178-Amphora_coffeaeformis.AAC.18